MSAEQLKELAEKMGPGKCLRSKHVSCQDSIDSSNLEKRTLQQILIVLTTNNELDCTPKAITHRISKFRNAKKTTNGDAGGTTASPKPRAPAKRTVTKSSTPASKRGGKKASPSPSASGAEESPARPKRSTPKRNYAQMAGDGTDSEDGDKGADGKYIKTEAGEEEPRDSPTEGIEFNFS